MRIIYATINNSGYDVASINEFMKSATGMLKVKNPDTNKFARSRFK